jgi:selenide,water dikinase
VLDKKRFGDAERALLTDPQTSGGLLVSCAPDAVTEVLAIFLQQGFAHAAVIGDIVAGDPVVKFAKEAKRKDA